MRTLYFVPSTTAPNSSGHELHLLPALRSFSKEFVYYNPIVSKHTDFNYIQEHILTLTKRHKINFFFAITSDAYLSPSTLDILRQKGITTVNYSCDNLDRPPNLAAIAPHFDLCWVSEPEAVAIMHDFKAEAIHLPMAANPKIFHPSRSISEIYDVSFCGAKNSSRPLYIYNLLEKTNLKTFISGRGWLDTDDHALTRSVADPFHTIHYILENLTFPEGRRNLIADTLHLFREPRPSPEVLAKLSQVTFPSPSFSELVKLYSQSRLSLGFNERGNSFVLPHPVFHHRLRDFEAPSSGACYLMYRLPEMQNYFIEDKEMLFYSSIEEFIEKIIFYSQSRRTSLRTKIRQGARKRVLAEHTWEHRFRRLFTALSIKL